MATKLKNPAVAANTAVDVSPFEKFTVYAASTSIVSLSYDGGTTWVTGPTLPTAGYITITDLATNAKTNAIATYIGQLSSAQ